MSLNPRSAHRGSGAWRIAVVEDHRLQRLRTVEVLENQRAFLVVYNAESLGELVTWLRSCRREDVPHLLVLDLVVDRGEDADPETVRSLVRAGVRVLVLSALASPPLLREMLRCGIGGVVSKRDTEADIVSAVWTVLGGGSWITPELASTMVSDRDRPRLSEQEERALVLYASGLSLDAVAEAIGVKPDTAKTYINRVKAKYADSGRPVRSKVDLVRIAIADGYLDPTGDIGR